MSFSSIVNLIGLSKFRSYTASYVSSVALLISVNRRSSHGEGSC